VNVVVTASVQVSITAAGRVVVDLATQRRRALIAGILAGLPARRQDRAMRVFGAAPGELLDSQWPAAVPAASGASATAVPQSALTANGRR
jgi:antitoxin (DNA-binding transcriptional repressor) of toxin-antitoxin stability system